MKVAVLLACTCAVLSSSSSVNCAAIKAPLEIISLDDLSESDRKYLEYLDQTNPRPKRSGDVDIISALKSTIGQGIKSKLGYIAKGSAAAVSHFSGGSSGSRGYHHHDIPETYEHKSFDFWSLKKSILNTLLQAVKAIKGGVIAVKGQLIKGGGHLISAKGKLISTKGEAITTLGKHIASSAVLIPPHHHGYSSSGHDAYPSHGHYHDHHHPSGPEYGSPSAPGPAYVVPDHYHHPPHHEDKHPDGGHAGIIILKKIPSLHSGRGHTHTEDYHHHKAPDFKPIEPSGPSFGTIVSKFFKASTSLKPGDPAPFGHTSVGHDTHHDTHEHVYTHGETSHHDYDHHDHHDHDDHHDHHGHHDHHDHHEHHDHHDHHHDHHDHDDHDFPEPEYPTHHHHSSHEDLPPQHTSSHSQLKPPSTSYGTPFEEAPSFLNLDHQYKSSESKHPPSSIEPTKPAHIDEIRPLSSFTSIGEVKATSLTGPGSVNSYPPYPPDNSVKPTIHTSDGLSHFGKTFKNPGTAGNKYLASQFLPELQNPLFAQAYDTISPELNYQALDSALSSSNKHSQKHPRHTRPKHKKHKPQRIKVVKSIAYELGPNGPKRL